MTIRHHDLLRWTRRRWLQQNALGLTALVARVPGPLRTPTGRRGGSAAQARARLAAQALPQDPTPWQALAQRAVDAAHAAGARYADARLTRTVVHRYGMGSVVYDNTPDGPKDSEMVGFGVRALVNGYWGFSASYVTTPDEAVRLGRDATSQAQENAKGSPWTVDLGTIPVATGTWATPIRIDPFTISVEEKLDFIIYWKRCAEIAGTGFVQEGVPSWLQCVRHEEVVATSEGALFTQTRYESGAQMFAGVQRDAPQGSQTSDVSGIEVAGAGWELFLDANIPEQFFSHQVHEVSARKAVPGRPITVGKYTLVCDGATVARLIENTLGIATQLDRALGYEANAGGTSFLDDPLGTVGNLKIASPLVTLTANRSAPQQLATVKWDSEGVTPQPFTVVKDGVLVDYQTTREQAAWLAPYYTKAGRPVHSNGCAAVQDAHCVPLQQLPNLSLEPGTAPLRIEDLVADVQDGILIESGDVETHDSQALTGVLNGTMSQIKHGRVGARLSGGAIFYDSRTLWQHLRALGGPSTRMLVGTSAFFIPEDDPMALYRRATNGKGQPPQTTSHSVQAVAAMFPDQALINPMRRA